MLINILMFIFGILLIACGTYLYQHRNKNFILFRPESDPAQQHFFKNFGIIFIVFGIINIIVILTNNTVIFSILLFLVCMLILVFNLIAGHFLTKKS